MVAEDLGGVVNEQFIGDMDDVVILSRALSATEVAQLAVGGAASVVPEPGALALFAGAAVAVLLIRRCRR